MKAKHAGLILAAGVFITSRSDLKADVTSYSIFEVANYHQVDDTQPTALDTPRAYYFGAQLFTDTNVNEVVTDANIISSGSTYYPLFPNFTGDLFTYNSDYFSSLTDLNTAFPGGTYEFDVDSATDSADLNEPMTPFYSTSIPYFNGNTWTNMQALDPAQPFTFTWNNFDVSPSADAGYIFVRVLNTTTFTYAYTTNFIPATTNSFVMPADTLNSGTSYQIQLLFSDRKNNAGTGFLSNAKATAGFDNLTYASLTTVAPTLSIVQADTNVVVSWPTAGSNYVLEVATDLQGSGWGYAPKILYVVGSQMMYTNAVADGPQFYRLYLPQNVSSIRKK